jgi:hypothetical protein
MIVNHVSVPGVATILEGTSVETTDTPSNLNLANGERILLAPSTSATIHQDRMILDRGRAELSGSSPYRIETADFRIGPSSPASRIHVAIQRAGRVNVEAVGGPGEVRNAQGVLVAKVLAGTALQLQATGAPTTQLTGVVRSIGGKYLLTDELSSVGVELRGANLSTMVGRRVDVVGSRLGNASAPAGMSQVVTVARVTLALDGSGSSGPSADSPDPSPGPPPSPPPPPPMTKGQKTALIIVGGAVVAGGTIGGLWAAGVIGGGTSVSQ